MDVRDAVRSDGLVREIVKQVQEGDTPHSLARRLKRSADAIKLALLWLAELGEIEVFVKRFINGRVTVVVKKVVRGGEGGQEKGEEAEPYAQDR